MTSEADVDTDHDAAVDKERQSTKQLVFAKEIVTADRLHDALQHMSSDEIFRAMSLDTIVVPSVAPTAVETTSSENTTT